MLMPERVSRNHDDYLKKFNREVDAGKRGILETKGRQLLARKRDGKEFFVSLDLTMKGKRDKKKVEARIVDLGNSFGTVTIDDKGTVRNVNKAMVLLFGFRSEKNIVGKLPSLSGPLAHLPQGRT